MTEYLLKLMQLKYPHFPTKMSPMQSKHALRNYGFVAEHYLKELKALESEAGLFSIDVALQFPFVEEKSITAEQQHEEETLKQERREAFRAKMKQLSERKQLE